MGTKIGERWSSKTPPKNRHPCATTLPPFVVLALRRGEGASWCQRLGHGGRGAPEAPSAAVLVLVGHQVLLLALLPSALVVVLLLQIPDGRPAVPLKVLLVLWRTAAENRLGPNTLDVGWRLGANM